MLAVRQIIQEREYAYDVQPPATPFQQDQATRGQVYQAGSYQAGQKKIPMVMITFISLDLKGTISSIHREEKSHQDNFRNEYVVGITAWPAIQFMFHEAF